MQLKRYLYYDRLVLITLLFLVIHFYVYDWWIRGLCIISIFMFFILKENVRAKISLSLLFISLATYLFFYWFDVNNHDFLIFYWVGICLLTCFQKNKRSYISNNARNLIVLVFSFASFWKFTTPQYRSGANIKTLSVVDSRINVIPIALNDMTKQDILYENRLLDMLRYDPDNKILRVSRQDQGQMSFSIYMYISWLVILGEFLIALLFLLSKFINTFKKIAHYVFISFIFITYQVVPISGFSFILSILGFATLNEENKLINNLYYITMLLAIINPDISIGKIILEGVPKF